MAVMVGRQREDRESSRVEARRAHPLEGSGGGSSGTTEVVGVISRHVALGRRDAVAVGNTEHSR